MPSQTSDFAAYPQPPWNGPDSLSAAITLVERACDKASSWRAYNDLLYAIGNNHAGTYYPVALAIIPQIREILLAGKTWPQFTVLDVLFDLCSSFRPELGFESFQGEALSTALRERVLSLRDDIKALADGTGIAANSASELLNLLNEKA